jgi:homoserine O-acetyltransferase/O-succinyltransferase
MLSRFLAEVPMRVVTLMLAALALACAPLASAQSVKLSPAEGDYIAKDFKFRSGETLPELRLHYTTLGKPHRNAKGEIDNAVLILHGTGGDGKQFFRPQFADVLFAPGGLLDPAKYYIVLRDGVGHGKSSKPSDGLRAKFPKYDYDDMVAADHELLTKGLGVTHARLIMGTSMGCMHSFVWGEAWPEFMDALMPLACLPTEIAGRNRTWRALIIQAVKNDPAWKGGDYTTQPVEALRTAAALQLVAGGAPIVMQKDYPNRDAADAYAKNYTDNYLRTTDANDLIYQFDASRTYDPSKALEKIKAPLTWVNSADDFINPPELGLAEGFAKRLKTGKYVLIPASLDTRGHGTHTWAALWKQHLADLLKRSQPK